MKYILPTVLITAILYGILSIKPIEKKLPCSSHTNTQCENYKQLPQGAVGVTKDNGYLYSRDFVGPLNQNDARIE